MLLDPGVNRRKYDREVNRLRQQQNLLTKRGCLLVEAKYPNVDVLFLPTKPVRLQFPYAPPQGAPAVGTAELGGLSARPFVARVGLDDYDLLAPSVVFLDAYSRQPLRDDQVVLGFLTPSTGVAQLVILGGHPTRKRAFLCVRGVREYHEHPQHTGDDWMLYRQNFGLMDVVDLIWRACIVSTRATLRLVPPRIDLHWDFEA